MNFKANKNIYHKIQKCAPQIGFNVVKVTSDKEKKKTYQLGIIRTELNFLIQLNSQNRKILKNTLFRAFDENDFCP